MNNTQKSMLDALRKASLKTYGKAVVAATAVTLVGAAATSVGRSLLPVAYTGGAWNIFGYVFGGIAYGIGTAAEAGGAAALAVSGIATATVGLYRGTKYGVKRTLEKLVH